MAKTTKRKPAAKRKSKAAAKRKPVRRSARKVATRKAPKKKAPAAKYGKRKDLGAPADGYFARAPASLREIANSVRQIVRSAVPRATETIKWGMPVYEHHGLLCYIRA